MRTRRDVARRRPHYIAAGPRQLHRGPDGPRRRLGQPDGLVAALRYRAPTASLCLAFERFVVSVPLLRRPDPHDAEGDDLLTQRPQLLNLELTILSEQKIAKVVALLEELRHDSPHLRNRIDELAKGMARPTDPQSMINATKETGSGPRTPPARPMASKTVDNLRDRMARIPEQKGGAALTSWRFSVLPFN